MKFGGAMFFTDYSMSAMELARALEERGFESVWGAEHSHIPLRARRRFRAAATCQNRITTRWIRSWCWRRPAR